MKKVKKIWLLALAVSLLLTCAACGKQKAPAADTTPTQSRSRPRTSKGWRGQNGRQKKRTKSLR